MQPSLLSRKLPPATGTVRWLDEIDPVSGNKYLRITVNGVSQDYEVQLIKGGYRLWKLDPQSFDMIYYDLLWWPGHNLHCSCPDASNRPERRLACKHARGLKAALDAQPF